MHSSLRRLTGPITRPARCLLGQWRRSLQLRVVGTTMGTRDELDRLIRFLVATGVRPVIDRTLPLEQVREGFAAMVEGELFGKVVFTR